MLLFVLKNNFTVRNYFNRSWIQNCYLKRLDLQYILKLLENAKKGFIEIYDLMNYYGSALLFRFLCINNAHIERLLFSIHLAAIHTVLLVYAISF